MTLSFLLSNILFASPDAFPDINVQYFRPAIDSTHFVWVNENNTSPENTFHFRTFVSYSSKPLIYIDKNGNETDVLKDLTQLDFVAGYTAGKLRLGIDVPFVVQAKGVLPSGDYFSESSLGNITLDGKYTLTNNDAPLGISLALRGIVPTTDTIAMGSSKPILEGEIALDTQIQNTTLAVNIGHREQADFSYERSVFGSQLFVRTGLGYSFSANQGLSLELNGSRLYEFIDESDALSSEAMISGWMVQNNLIVRGGIGMGIGSGIGTPVWRALGSIEYKPAVATGDQDGDGIIDQHDKCISVQEDIDGVEDEDGCPDLTDVTITFVDQFGVPVPRKKWKGKGIEGYSGVPFHSKAREFILRANIDGYRPVVEEVSIRNGFSQEIEIPVEMILGTLGVIAKDPNGNTIPDAVWNVDGSSQRNSSGDELQLPPKEYVVQVAADGYKMKTERVAVQPEQVVNLAVELVPTKAQVKDGRINFEGVIHYKTNSSIIERDSYALLNDIGDILRDFPAIEKIRIEGHTDSDGSASMNKRLSQSRAESVVEYLVQYGIDRNRMMAVGMGEEKPIATNSTAKGKKANRRVEIHIIKVDQSKVNGIHEFDLNNKHRR